MEKKIWTKQETKKFIALYKENPILWNKNSADYRNITKKRRIQINLSLEFNTTVAEICKKIGTLRTQWLKENRKIKNRRWEWYSDLKPIFDLIEDKEPEATYLHIGEDSETQRALSFMEDEVSKNSNSDEHQIFGNYVALKLRSMHYEKNIRGLKKLIQLYIDQWTAKDDKEYYSIEDKEPEATYLHIGEDSETQRALSFMEDEVSKNSNSDEHQIFGNYVALKLRSMHYEKNIRGLKKLIQLYIDQWTAKDDKEYYSANSHS